MRRLSAADIRAVMECLGYLDDLPGSYVSSGKVIGPKGVVFGTIEADEFVTEYEVTVFLTDAVQLLEEDVKRCISAFR